MKYSTTPTPFILVKASTTSEWDNCSCAIIHASDEWRQSLAKRWHAIAPLFDKDDGLYRAGYWEWIEGFYAAVPEDLMEENLTGKSWIYIELDPGELDNLPVPESKLEIPQLVITRYATLRYETLGEHTGELFWTEDILVNELIEPTPKTLQK